jgi:hypothetical protein
MDENVETSLEGKISVKQFPTIIGRSKSGVHPILFHCLTSDPIKCFKYKYTKKTNKEDAYYYICEKCIEIKAKKEEYAKNVVRTIRVTLDYNFFCSNPESNGHFCTDSNEYFLFEAIEVQQVYRYFCL